MPSTDLLREAERVMTICNACRYCEGFCAVFPALEMRRRCSEQDLKYLANLCHNCRDCYYACQYAPPHQFALNVPRALAELRMETYRDFTWPARLRGLFYRNGLAVASITLISVLAVLFTTLSVRGSAVFFGFYPGSFYQVIPFTTMVATFSVLALFSLVSLLREMAIFWRETGGGPGEMWNIKANLQALADALRLKYLTGGGQGCNYPDARFSMLRRTLHHVVFYGFFCCLAATGVAAIYDHLLHWPAPYPFWSWPVVLGTLGGIALLAGTGGLLYLRGQMDRAPAARGSSGMDVGFTVLLFLIALTGVLLLLLRATPLMGLLLTVHLGLVAGLFVTLPCGKFVHALYRYVALARNALERSRLGM